MAAVLSLSTPSGIAFDNSASLRKIASLKAKAPNAEARALNRTAATGRTLITRFIAGELKAKPNAVRNRITIRQARPNQLEATLGANPKRLGLIDLGARGSSPSRGRGRGVRVAGKVYPHTFIATMPSGHKGVFIREAGGVKRGPKPNRSQLPIVELFGPSVWLIFSKNLDWAIAQCRPVLIKNLQHEFRFLLQQQARP